MLPGGQVAKYIIAVNTRLRAPFPARPITGSSALDPVSSSAAAANPPDYAWIVPAPPSAVPMAASQGLLAADCILAFMSAGSLATPARWARLPARGPEDGFST
jgi:hypothetical protein